MMVQNNLIQLFISWSKNFSFNRKTLFNFNKKLLYSIFRCWSKKIPYSCVHIMVQKNPYSIFNKKNIICSKKHITLFICSYDGPEIPFSFSYQKSLFKLMHCSHKKKLYSFSYKNTLFISIQNHIHFAYDGQKTHSMYCTVRFVIL